MGLAATVPGTEDNWFMEAFEGSFRVEGVQVRPNEARAALLHAGF